METKLQAGLRGSKEMQVSIKDTALEYGSGSVEVFATPAMIAFMESTAMESIEGLLPETQTTVGTEICVKHFHPTVVGKKVYCTSLLTKLDGKKFVFEVKVFENKVVVGQGTHTRFIVDKEIFLSKLKSK